MAYYAKNSKSGDVMKGLLIGTTLLLATSSAFAVTKCIVDGKTIYQSGPCLTGQEKRLEANVSNVGSDGLRREVQQNNSVREKQRANQQCDALMQQAMEVGDGSYMSFSELGAAKRRAKAALELFKSTCGGGQTKETDDNPRDKPAGYMTKDAFGNYQNSNNSFQAKDAYGNYQNSKDSYQTKDAFGNYQNSNDCFQTKDAFGNYQQSSGCNQRE
jgi:hypothetical protein